MNRMSIVIVNYRSGRELASCLRSVVRNAGQLDYEIFVINNDRPEDLSPVSDLESARVRVIQNRSNRGFAAAANQGYRQARGPFLLLLNPDVRVEAGALEILADTLQRHPDAGVALPRLNSPDGSLQYSCRRFLHHGHPADAARPLSASLVEAFQPAPPLDGGLGPPEPVRSGLGPGSRHAGPQGSHRIECPNG